MSAAHSRLIILTALQTETRREIARIEDLVLPCVHNMETLEHGMQAVAVLKHDLTEIRDEMEILRSHILTESTRRHSERTDRIAAVARPPVRPSQSVAEQIRDIIEQDKY